MKIKNIKKMNLNKQQKNKIVKIAVLTLGVVLLSAYLMSRKTIDSVKADKVQEAFKSTEIPSDITSEIDLEPFEEELKNSMVAIDVINGKYKNGEKRKELLENAGYEYEKIQVIVNKWYKNQKISERGLVPIVADVRVEENGKSVLLGYVITSMYESGETRVFYFDIKGNELFDSKEEQEYTRNL